MGHHSAETVVHTRFSRSPTIFLLNLSEVGLVLMKKILMGHRPGKTVAHERQDSFPEAAVTSFWLMQYIHSGIKSKESQNTPNFFIFCLASQFGGLEIICQLHNIHSGVPE